MEKEKNTKAHKNAQKVCEKNIINKREYDFLREAPQLKGRLGLVVMGGSRAYGTNLPESDYDVRGMCFEKPEDIIGYGSFEQYDDKVTDTTIYGFNKFIKLLSNCNPNIVEFIGVREDDILYKNNIGDEIIKNKDLFISQKASSSFGGYAMQQLNRLENGIREGGKRVEKQRNSLEAMIHTFNNRYTEIPMGGLEARVSEDDKLVIDIDVKGYPLADMRGVMSEMSEVLKHKGVGNRNKKATVKKLDKHAMHLIRLYYMVLDILEKGEIKTYREEEHELLMSIRQGKYRIGESLEMVAYTEEFWGILSELRVRFEYARKNTSIQREPNYKRIEEFKMEVNRQIIQGKI